MMIIHSTINHIDDMNDHINDNDINDNDDKKTNIISLLIVAIFYPFSQFCEIKLSS